MAISSANAGQPEVNLKTGFKTVTVYYPINPNGSTTKNDDAYLKTVTSLDAYEVSHEVVRKPKTETMTDPRFSGGRVKGTTTPAISTRRCAAGANWAAHF